MSNQPQYEELQLVEVEKEKTNEEKIQELLKKADVVIQRIKIRKQRVL